MFCLRKQPFWPKSVLPVFPPAIPRIFSSTSHPHPPFPRLSKKNRKQKQHEATKKPRCKWRCSEISSALWFEEVGHKLNLSEMSRSLVHVYLVDLPSCQPLSPQLFWDEFFVVTSWDLFKQRPCCCDLFDKFAFTSNKLIHTWLLLDITLGKMLWIKLFLFNSWFDVVTPMQLSMKSKIYLHICSSIRKVVKNHTTR